MKATDSMVHAIRSSCLRLQSSDSIASLFDSVSNVQMIDSLNNQFVSLLLRCSLTNMRQNIHVNPLFLVPPHGSCEHAPSYGHSRTSELVPPDAGFREQALDTSHL
jgi:hypothetical protein